MKKSILVTGSAGFIGANLVLKLLEKETDAHIVGIDNMNEQEARLIFLLRHRATPDCQPCHLWNRALFYLNRIPTNLKHIQDVQPDGFGRLPEYCKTQSDWTQCIHRDW